jgi:hypothetical protein
MTILICTGTLRGGTSPQLESLNNVIRDHDRPITMACHGLAIGIDFQFHQLCRKNQIPIRGYPCTIKSKQADIPASEFAVLLPAKDSLSRNHDMIDYAVLSSEESQLIVCPKRDYEELRSGTWATVRYARRASLDILYIWPSDGALEPRRFSDLYYHSRNRHV